MTEKHDLVKYINEYKKKHYGQEWGQDGYLFKPLVNIPSKKGKEEKNRNGFLVYSEETIKTNLINRSETLEQRFQCVYEKCNDYKKIKDNENYIYRYYYYQELEYQNNEKPSNFDKNRKLATIIMINPAFASSRDNDPTINNISDFLESLKFKSFEIVNLYPIRLPKPDCLDCFNSYLNFNEDNYHKFLMQYLQQKNNGELIAAWGNKYNVKAKKIFTSECGLQFHSYKKGEPAHFSSQRFNNVKRKGLFLFTPTELDA